MLKVIYAGSPEPAAQTLQLLIQNASANNFEIVAVITNPPSAKGRHKELTPTPVGSFVQSYNQTAQNQIALFTPEHLDKDFRSIVEPFHADILVCFAYGHIFGPKFLSLFSMGGINLHPSLLPKYRGCTPVPAAILNCDKETAFSVQTLAQGMDEGDILALQKVELTGTETSESLLNDAAINGAKLITEILSDAFKNGKLKKGVPQQGIVSYTQIIKKEDGKIDWCQSAKKIDAQIRAYTPEPATFCIFENNQKTETLRIIQATILAKEKCSSQNSTYKIEFENATPGTVLAFDKQTGIWVKTGDDILCVTKLQKQGKNVMGYKDFMNGTRDFVGSLLK